MFQQFLLHPVAVVQQFQLSMCFVYDTNERTGLGNDIDKITAEMNYSDMKDTEREAVL